MSNELVPMDQMQKMAQIFASSKMFGCKTPDEAMAIMLLAQAEGMHPATAARDYHVIQGRPAMKADAMLSRYLQSGGKVRWIDYTDAKVTAEFSHPAGGTVVIDWTQDRARAAGLSGKDNWKHYPRQMLRARVISEGVRTTNPAVATGIYSEAEVEDMARFERDMGAAEIVHDDKVFRPAGTTSDAPPRSEAGADVSYRAQLENAATLDDLARVWATVPKEHKAGLAATKEARKAALQQPASEPTSEQDDFVREMESAERNGNAL